MACRRGGVLAAAVSPVGGVGVAQPARASATMIAQTEAVRLSPDLLVNSAGQHSGSYRDAAAAKKEWDELKIKATAWIDDHDGKVGKLYGMKTTPHMFVIDPKGSVAYQGAIDNRPEPEGDPRKARNYVREAITKLTAGGKIEVAETRSYGCGVKYSN